MHNCVHGCIRINTWVVLEMDQKMLEVELMMATTLDEK